MSDLNQRTDGMYHMTAAFKAIKEALAKSGIELVGYGEPRVTADGDYKVEWWQEDAEGTITLYSDGVWTLEDGKWSSEGKITPLHYKTWVRRLIRAGIHYGLATGGYCFFKDLMTKKKPL